MNGWPSGPLPRPARLLQRRELCLGITIALHVGLLVLLWAPRTVVVIVSVLVIPISGYVSCSAVRSRSFGLPVRLVTPEFPRRLARELHDTVGHSLTAISLHARAAGRAQPHPQLAFVDELAQQTIRRLGNIVYALRTGAPAAEDEPAGLTDAVQRAVRELRGLGPPIRCGLTGPDVRPPAGVLRLVRHVVTEALINGLKNGPLREAHVQLRVDDEIEVRVLTYRGEPADEGPELVGLGLGLRGLAEEAHNYGGLLSCHQSLGGRFCVSARIPLFWKGTAPTARPGGGTAVERTEVLA